MKTWKTLIRREFWENRALWIAPVAAAGFMIVGSIALLTQIGGIKFGPNPMRGFGQGMRPGMGEGTSFDQAYAMSVFVFAWLIMVVGTVAIGAFVLDSLCAERKDRSILFWKSLPVSDSQTVLSKAAVALVVMPVGLYLLAVATHLLCTGILSLRPAGGMPLAAMWNPLTLGKAYVWLGAVVAVNALWYAPLVAYGMLASVLARRVPLMMAVMPPLVVALGERTLLGSNYSWIWMWRRNAPRVKLTETLQSPELWIGVALAVVLILVVIRLRRWRDDS